MIEERMRIEIRVERTDLTNSGKRYVVLVDGKVRTIKSTKGGLFSYLKKVI